MGIVIVDDSKFNLTLISGVLSKAGYSNIQTVNSAHELLRLLGISASEVPRRAVPVDLILLDIVMPELDGISACKQIKAIPVYSDLPIIFLTGDKEHFKEAFNAGGTDFIEKGGPEYELLARVKSALRLKKEMDIRKSREQRMQKELQLAQHLQKSVLSPPIDEPRIQIHGKYIQSEEVSGDMFYWTKIDEQTYGVLLIDVSGHGLSSALISMSVRSMMEEMVSRLVEPEWVCGELNKQIMKLFTNSKYKVYFTAIYVLIDFKRDEIRYFNAGHPPGLILLEEGGGNPLAGTTTPIGILREMKCNVALQSIQRPAKLLLYTDGLVETPGLSIRSGIARLQELAESSRHLPNPEFLNQLEALVQHKTDDVCIISIALL